MATPNNYNRLEVETYIRLLGCWTAPNPEAAAHSRSDADYRRVLKRCIEVNATRHDAIGIGETLAAKQALLGLVWKK